METPVRYQVTFSGHLRKGYTADAVKQNLARRLKLPLEKVEQLFAAGRAVLKQTSSEDEARRIVMQLAATGAIASIEPVQAPPAAVQAAAPGRSGSVSHRAKPTAAKPAKFHPLRHKSLLKPLLYLAASFEVVLNLLYTALVLAVAGGVLLPSLITTWVGRYIDSPLLALLLQLLVIVLALALLLMLLKPLLSLRLNYRHGIALPAVEEADLHAFIEDVCERIGAPMPVEIRVHKDAEILTAYHQGPLGFLRNRTVLTIGVPLIAGMNCSQLAALVARTLNRYRHKFAPHATAIVLAVHNWLQRAVYEQDIVDLTLQRWHEERRVGDGLFNLLRRLLAPARRIASWRLRLSRLLERPLVHRIVAEADKMALAFTGTEGFIRMLDQNSLLAFAEKNLLPGLEEQYRNQGVLPDNLVEMMLLRSRQYPVNMPQKLRAIQEQQKVAIGDIVPSDNQRLKRIEHQPIYGAYYCLSPAAVLFRNYSKLARRLTLRYYHHRLQLPISPFRLQRVSAKNSLENFLQQQLDGYYRKLYVDFVPLKLRQHMHEIGSLAVAKQQWGIGTARSVSEYERAVLAREHFSDAEEELVDAATLEEVHLAGLWREWGVEKRKPGDLADVHQDARDAENGFEQAAHSLEQYLSSHNTRLAALLAALTLGEDTAADNARALAQEVHSLVSLLERIEHIHVQLSELKLQTTLLETLISYRTATRQQKLDSRIEQRSADVSSMTSAIGVALKSATYPFADRKSALLMDYVLEEASSENSPQGSFDRGHETVARLALVQRRALVRLIEIAKKVEAAMGFRA